MKPINPWPKPTIKTKLVFIPAFGAQEKHEVELTSTPSSVELHQFIDPLLGTRQFEHVLVYPSETGWLGADHYRDMFVDETGMVKGLPRNIAATALYRRNFLVHQQPPVDDDDTLPAIYGPAVFFPDRKVWL